jgi:hypothetical protein
VKLWPWRRSSWFWPASPCCCRAGDAFPRCRVRAIRKTAAAAGFCGCSSFSYVLLPSERALAIAGAATGQPAARGLPQAADGAARRPPVRPPGVPEGAAGPPAGRTHRPTGPPPGRRPRAAPGPASAGGRGGGEAGRAIRNWGQVFGLGSVTYCSLFASVCLCLSRLFVSVYLSPSVSVCRLSVSVCLCS